MTDIVDAEIVEGSKSKDNKEKKSKPNPFKDLFLGSFLERNAEVLGYSFNSYLVDTAKKAGIDYMPIARVGLAQLIEAEKYEEAGDLADKVGLTKERDACWYNAMIEHEHNENYARALILAQKLGDGEKINFYKNKLEDC